MTNFTFSPHSSVELQQDRQGFHLAAYLNLGQREVPHDISERLRLARQRALAVRKPTRISAVTLGAGHATLAWREEEPVSWWARVGSLVPLLALVCGLLLIHSFQNDSRARELAEVDLALLTDDLPVEAYADPGFLQFLKTHN